MTRWVRARGARARRSPRSALRCVGLLALGLANCERTAQPLKRDRLPYLLAWDSRDLLTLRAIVEPESIRTSYRGPVHVLIALTNGDAGSWIDMESRRFTVRVLAPNGQEAKSLPGESPSLKSLPQRFVPRDPGASSVEVRDLRCVRESEDIPPEVRKDDRLCLRRYVLDDTGRYRVVVNWLAPDFVRMQDIPLDPASKSYFGTQDRPAPRMEFDPKDRRNAVGSAVFWTGLVLADTAVLTVTPR